MVQVKTDIVFSSSCPRWSSNGAGCAFVFPLRRPTGQETCLFISLWDGRDGDRPFQIGSARVGLLPVLLETCKDPNSLPESKLFPVDLIPQLAALGQGEAQLSLILAKASPAVAKGKQQAAVSELIGLLNNKRRTSRLERQQQWERNYSDVPQSMKSSCSFQSAFSSLSYLSYNSLSGVTVPCQPKFESPLNVEESYFGPASNCQHKGLYSPEHVCGDAAPMLDANASLRKVQQLARSMEVPAVARPLRAQAELVARLHPVRVGHRELAVLPARGLRFVLRGQCELQLRGQRVALLGPGHWLGEDVLLGSLNLGEGAAEMEQGVVRAHGLCEMLELRSEDLWLALDVFPGLLRDLLQLALSRRACLSAAQASAPADAVAVMASAYASCWTVAGPLLDLTRFLLHVAGPVHFAHSPSAATLSPSAPPLGDSPLSASVACSSAELPAAPHAGTEESAGGPQCSIASDLVGMPIIGGPMAGIAEDSPPVTPAPTESETAGGCELPVKPPTAASGHLPPQSSASAEIEPTAHESLENFPSDTPSTQDPIPGSDGAVAVSESPLLPLPRQLAVGTDSHRASPPETREAAQRPATASAPYGGLCAGGLRRLAVGGLLRPALRRTRFRRAYDAFTSEDLGMTPRWVCQMVLSGLSLRLARGGGHAVSSILLEGFESACLNKQAMMRCDQRVSVQRCAC